MLTLITTLFGCVLGALLGLLIIAVYRRIMKPQRSNLRWQAVNKNRNAFVIATFRLKRGWKVSEEIRYSEVILGRPAGLWINPDTGDWDVQESNWLKARWFAKELFSENNDE